MPTRTGLIALTNQRLADADALLQTANTDAAFYIGGYAVELALKAAICKTLDRDDFYETDRSNRSVMYVQDKVMREFKTHNFSDLLILSGLSTKLNTAIQADAALEQAWADFKFMGWSEQSRYELGNRTAGEVVNFVENTKTVVSWISNYW